MLKETARTEVHAPVEGEEKAERLKETARTEVHAPVMKLSGYICVRDALALDYCVALAARSLLPVVDELILCDSDSTDGTTDLLHALAETDARIRVMNRTWEDARGDNKWWVRWLNFAREHCTHDMQITLDADEVLDDSPACHAAVRAAVEAGECRKFDRLNYWRSPRQLIPDGHCCGKFVTRMGPARFWMPSDEPHHAGECEILDRATFDPALVIHHLGFLRDRDAFYRKAKVVLHAFFNRYDTRLEDAEREGKPVWESECAFSNLLAPYDGPWPEGVRRWLVERGFEG